MPVVVTGAAGFIGSHLVRAQLADGQEVIGIDRRAMPSAPGFTALTADLSEPDDRVTDALRDAEVIYHLAGCPGVRDRSADVEWRRHRDNVLTTERVLACAPGTTPVVLASSSSVYGGAEHGPCREDQPLRPRGGYAESKVRAEQLCEQRRDRGGAVIVARFFTVAGERQRPDMALARWIADVSAGRPARVLGDVRRSRDITDVRDVVAAVRLLAKVGAGGVVNVGTGVAHTLREMLDAVSDALGRPLELDIEPVPDDDPDATLADPTRLTALTGMLPRTDLAALVRRQVADALQDPGSPASDSDAEAYQPRPSRADRS